MLVCSHACVSIWSLSSAREPLRDASTSCAEMSLPSPWVKPFRYGNLLAHCASSWEEYRRTSTLCSDCTVVHSSLHERLRRRSCLLTLHGQLCRS